jgi:hypothetical protein
MDSLYTKAVLTVIAVALVALVLQNAIPGSQAQSRIQKVAICNAEDPDHCAAINEYGQVQVHYY